MAAQLRVGPPAGGNRAEASDRGLTGAPGMRRPDRWDAAIGGYALLAALCRPLSAPAAVAVLLPGLLLAVLRASRPVRPLAPHAQPRRAALQWLALAALGGLWWLVAFQWGNDATHPTLSLLLDPVLDTYGGRVAGYACWLAAGRWLVTR
jgi:hypothetical protein